MYGLWLASTAAMFWLPLHPPLQSNSKNPRQFEWQIIWRNGESIDRRPSTKTPYRVKLPRRPPPESLCLLALHGECLRPCKSRRRISNRNLWWMVPPLPLLVVCLRPPRLPPVPPLVSRVARRHVTSLACDPLPWHPSKYTPSGRMEHPSKWCQTVPLAWQDPHVFQIILQ